MATTRRRFLLGAAAGALAASPAAGAEPAKSVTVEDLDRILAAPVLKLDSLDRPVKVASMELLRNGKTYLLRTRSTDGAEAITMPHPAKTADVYPFILRSVLPVFVGKDARTVERLLWDVYRHADNYKMQGIALWVGVAAAEIGLLELMGRVANRPVADFFGGAVRRDVPVYFASGNRGNTPEAEVEYLQKLVAGSGVKALKFRLGGRMSRNADDPPGRTEKLIPLARRAFGPGMTLYGDANSSYDVAHAVPIGRLMEEHGYGFYEEPCEFDDLWGTKAVADALTIPVALGEQEYSLHRWKWVIANRGADVIQPDIHYGGGFIRATQVARMAAAAGLPVVPHMSGGGLGFLDVVHFASFTPNIGPFMEFKGNPTFPVTSDTSPLRVENGSVRCPTGPGFGVMVAPEFVRAAKAVTAG
jgi:L-alanine-DL-glutamate epimerase-like enolase superfamily enzyme